RLQSAMESAVRGALMVGKERIAEWQQLAVGDGMQVFGLKPLLMQIEDRVQEVQTLCNAGSSAGSSEQLRAAVLKVQSML
ncbi:unnamed protein product, partial [Symbiodinium sp. CCMP2456]